MTLDALAGRLSPDVPDTVKRFPFPILLAALATLILIGVFTEVLRENQDFWGRTMLGFATGAIFATGGALFAETRKRGSILGLVAAYVVPVATIAAWQVTSSTWLVPIALPVAGSLWTSVAATTRGWHGVARIEAQDRFWWINHLAITSAAIVGVAYLVVLLGTFAIGQSVSVLFRLDLSMPLYEIALPAIGGFFAPLYWLSTLPRAYDYQPGRLDAPDFLVRAVATIGKFILIPLLLAYAAILLVYALQIVVTQQLPEGMLGWMVLGFVTAGAGAWLILYPDFLGTSVIVRFFHRWWFWATVVPLVLYAVAVQVRIDAYGLTEERLLLVWAGIWAVALTVIFLLRRGDIRLIPGIAAVCLLLATVGPWNVVGLSRMQQAATLDTMLPITGPNGESYGVTPAWTPEEFERARGAIDYLMASHEGRAAVREILRLKGFDLPEPDQYTYVGTNEVLAALGVTDPVMADAYQGYTLVRDPNVPVDVGPATLYVGELVLYRGAAKVQVFGMDAGTIDPGPDTQMQGLGFALGDTTVRISRGDTLVAEIDLDPWFTPSTTGAIATPFADFEIDGRRYRLVMETFSVMAPPAPDETGAVVNFIDGKLFAGPIPPAPPPAAEPTAQDQPAPAT